MLFWQRGLLKEKKLFRLLQELKPLQLHGLKFPEKVLNFCWKVKKKTLMIYLIKKRN